MNTNAWKRLAVASLTTGLFSYGIAMAAPYVPVASPVAPVGGPALPPPSVVPGKEYSEGGPLGLGPDRTAAGAPDPLQNVAWDGSGGVTDGNDYSGPPARPWPEGQVDAIANGFDALYPDVITDTETSNLLFSIGNGTAMLGSGLTTTSGGNIIGRAGDISFEKPGIPMQGVWAVGATDIDVTTPPVDIDGLDIWGPEPPGPFDSNKFSLLGDASTGVSIWDFTSMSPYLLHTTVIDAVLFLLGLPVDAEPQQIDLDALMVYDAGDDKTFGQVGDSLIFSIRQLPDMFDPSGYYATGSEIFKLDYDGVGPVGGVITPSYLFHGGHLWDKAYALSAMVDVGTGRQLDINALEAASIPEPSRAFLLLLGAAGMLRRRR